MKTVCTGRTGTRKCLHFTTLKKKKKRENNRSIIPVLALCRTKIDSSDQQGRRYDGISSPLFGHHKMYGMTAVTSECPLAANICQINNGDCADNTICLPTVNDVLGRTCHPRNWASDRSLRAFLPFRRSNDKLSSIYWEIWAIFFYLPFVNE